MAHYRPHLKTATDARAVRTRTALRAAILRLVGLRSLDEITVQDICQQADVGYTTFFRHYPAKEALLDDVAVEQIAQLVGLALPIADEKDLHTAAMALFTYVEQHRKLWSALLTGGAEIAMRKEFLQIARQLAATRARPDIWPPADISTILIVSSTVELVSWWLQQKKPLSIDEVVSIYENCIIRPNLGGKAFQKPA